MSAFEDDARYRLLVASIADYAVYLLEPDGTIASWNAGAARIKGYEPSEIIGKNFALFYTPEDRANGLPERALSIAQNEGTFASEGVRLRKDGSRFPTHVTIHPVYDPQGTLIGFAKITRDLTSQKQAEHALRESEQQFRLLVQGVVDYAIYLIDPAGNVMNWNAGAERIKGYTANEIVGQHFSRFYPEADQAKDLPKRNLERALRDGRFDEEGWRVRKDGSTFFAAVVIDPIFDPDGRHIGFAKITRDISDNRRHQAQLEAAKAELFQAQKMDAVGQLTGGIAHDFNNLLMVIRSSLDLLRKRLNPTDASAVRLLENAARATERGASLTSRMLAFAKRQDLEKRVVDVGTLLRGMAELINHSVGTTISVEIKLPLRLPAILVDPHQLESSVLNLAVNARDAMPAGGTMLICAELRRVNEDDVSGIAEGSYVAVIVQDDGTGMDEVTRARAVEPFFTTKGVGKGSGLGLSMVHGFAEQSGGALQLESTPGRGTTATLLVPVAQQDDQTVQADVPGDTAPRAANALKVLAVDDDFLVLMNIATMLEDLGHEVWEAPSANDALQILEAEGPFDLLITDHAMPKMTGAELIAKVKASNPSMPIILASGYADIPGGTPEGVGRLAKPFNQNNLSDAVALAIRGTV